MAPLVKRSLYPLEMDDWRRLEGDLRAVGGTPVTHSTYA